MAPTISRSSPLLLVGLAVLRLCPLLSASEDADALVSDVELPNSCHLSPQMHQPHDYPVSHQAWDIITRLTDHYKDIHGLCQPSSTTPKWPPLPSIQFHRLKMSDGVFLWTIVVDISPHNGSKKGAVICRSPYGPTTQNLADVYALTNGQVVILQDDRGTWRSGGEWDLWRGSGQDAMDTMNWIISQPWSNGEVYTVGVSADGISVATAILDSPTMIKAQWYGYTTMQGHHFTYPQGAYRLDMEQYVKGLDAITRGASARVISEMRHHEVWSKWWYNLTMCQDLSSPTEPQCHYQHVTWPVILSMGIWDIFHKSSYTVWDGLRMDSDPRVRDSHVLFIGPLGHCILGSPHHPIYMLGEAQGFLQAMAVSSEFFRGNTHGPARGLVKRINFYVMGAYDGATGGNYWTSVDEFPETTPMALYLASGGMLTGAKPEGESSVEYIYDPLNPTPMLGGANTPTTSRIPVCGTADMSARDERGDVMTFDGRRLGSDVTVAGKIFVRLYVSSSAKDTDYFVTIEDVKPRIWPFKTTSYLVCYGVVRMRWRTSDEAKAPHMEPGKIYEVGIDCGFTSYIFQKGHHVRVTVSSAAFPYFNANSNTGLFELDNKVIPVTANNTIHLGGKVASVLVLPTVDVANLERNTHFDQRIPPEIIKTPSTAVAEDAKSLEEMENHGDRNSILL